jgi:ferredoxin
MRVVVDRDRCEGNAICVGIDPDLFQLDDDDYVVVTADPIPAEAVERAERAIAECPRAALARRD